MTSMFILSLLLYHLDWLHFRPIAIDLRESVEKWPYGQSSQGCLSSGLKIGDLVTLTKDTTYIKLIKFNCFYLTSRFCTIELGPKTKF